MAGHHAAAQHELAGAAAVGPQAGKSAAEAQADADFGQAVARHEGASVEAPGGEGVGEAVERRGPDHVGADACQFQARQVEVARHLRLGAAGDQLVAEARTVGDGGAASRDQRQPLQGPACEVARRQKVDAALGAHRRQHETDQAHVVIERQPAHAGIAGVDLLARQRAVDVGHELVLADIDAQRPARAAGRVLHIAALARAERP